jgi:Ca-activated chloride channel family protein
MDMDNRLGLVKKSLEILVSQMSENDKIGIVVYGTTGRKLLEPTAGSNKNLIMNAINELNPEGSTNAAEGLMLGYDMAYNSFIEGGNNRVILCTDGVANQGITKAEDILKMVEDYKSKGITLTTLGFGMDNFNDIFLEKLADNGDGNYSYIDTLEEAKKVFIDQLAGTLQVIAKDAKAQIEFNKASVESYRLIGYENRTLDTKDFKNNSVDAGEVGAGHAVTALYEIKLNSSVGESIGTVKLRYKNPQTNNVTEVNKQIKSSQICNNFYDATPRFRFMTIVAQTAEILKGSPWASNTSLQEVFELLVSDDMKKLDMNEEDSEFIDLVKEAIDLKTPN